MKPSFRAKLHLRSWIVSGVLCYAIWDTYHRLSVDSSDAGTLFPILSLAVNMLLVGALWLCLKRLLALTHERAGEASSTGSVETPPVADGVKTDPRCRSSNRSATARPASATSR